MCFFSSQAHIEGNMAANMSPPCPCILDQLFIVIFCKACNAFQLLDINPFIFNNISMDITRHYMVKNYSHFKCTAQYMVDIFILSLIINVYSNIQSLFLTTFDGWVTYLSDYVKSAFDWQISFSRKADEHRWIQTDSDRIQEAIKKSHLAELQSTKLRDRISGTALGETLLMA